jgi:hypothetical protein
MRRVYWNGQQVSKENTNIGCDYESKDIGALLLGKGFTGLLDDVIIYNRVLNAAEVKQLYRLDGCCGG